MIKVEPGYEKSVYRELKTKSEIKDVYRLFGEYSFFLVMQAEGQTRLNQLMLDIEEEEYVIKTRPFKLMNGELAEDFSN
jgi:muconolactone delta-isomerase